MSKATARPLEVRLRDGATMRAEWWEGGDRQAVLVHDLGDDLDAVRPITRGFVNAGFTAIAIDRIGHGASDDRPGGDPVPGLADDLVDLVERLDTGAGIYLVGVGEAAVGCLAVAGAIRPSLVALVSPRELGRLSSALVGADRSPTLVVYGALDPEYEAEARRLSEARPGPALLVRLAVETQAGALIESALGPQVVNHIVGYARQIAPRPRRGGS